MYKICLILILFILYSNVLIGQDYLIKYRIQSQIDSTNADFKMEEIATLLIENKIKSYFYTDNFATKDSVRKLVSSGKVSAFEVMSNKENLKHTRFNQHIVKDLRKYSVDLFENILTLNYLCAFQPNFQWETQPDTLTINGYLCSKAKGFFGGRNYIAWFTNEIPISDGPYVFFGLPGLIIKIYDDKEHYDFTLISLEQSMSRSFLKVPSSGEKIINASREQVFEVRERLRTQFLDVVKYEMGFDVIETPEMQQKRKQKQKSDNNPLELSIN